MVIPLEGLLKLTPLNSNAGFFIFLDLSPYLQNRSNSSEVSYADPEIELAQSLLDAGVGLHPREEHWESPGFFRLVFTHERSVLKEGLSRCVVG
jgi:1-aminocyclopropane-1-carboxylate synthase